MKIKEAILEINKKIGEVKRYRNEQVSECPYCKSTKQKFYINLETGMFNCKLGSCNKKGNLTTLVKHLGLDIQIEYDDKKYSAPKKVSKLNVDVKKFDELTDDMDMVNYMMSRGISIETLKDSGCLNNKRHNALVIPNYVNKDLVSVIYRKADKSIFMEAGSKQFLWGTDMIDKKNDTIFITEGHIDALTLMEMGIDNVTSMPNGCNSHEWISLQWDLLNKFKKIVLCYDNDTAGKNGLDEAKNRLDFANLYTLEYGDYNDINEMYMDDSEELYKTVRNPIAIEMDGFVSLQNVSTSSGVTVELYSCGLSQLDRIFGGIGLYQSTIICAESGAGKSTVVSNMIRGIISEGEKVAIFSGEFGNKQLKTWLYATMGGEKAIDLTQHPFRQGEFLASIKPEYEKRLDRAVDGKLFVYDGNKSNAFDMLKHFKMLHKKHGVKYFFVDNLSIIDITRKGMGQYEAEAEFSKQVAEFTRNNGVHLYMIAHPTKVAINTEPNFVDKNGRVKALEKYTQQMVRGSATLVNLAHNVLFLSRAKDHEKAYFLQSTFDQYSKANRLKEFEKIKPILETDFSLLGYLVKNRGTGAIYENALFGYDATTKRIYGLMNKEEDLSREILKEEEVISGEENFELILDDGDEI